MARRTMHHPVSRRGGFTLIEMTVVILIIGILAALIVPAVQSARRTARNAAVVSELNQLTSAINQFRNTYGVEPPSSITIHTTQAGWAGDPLSRSKIARLWPNFDFSMSLPNCAPAAWGQANVLTGAECLVFFLGGINTGVQPQGFSKNPAAPFTVPGSDNRDGPYYDFKSSRFCDVDADGFVEYRDSIPTQTLPIIYASSNEGQGYVATDLIVSNNTFTVGSGDMSLPYQTAAPVLTRSGINAKSYQLISPGFDGIYGTGGAWGENFATVIASDVQPGGLYATATASQSARIHELDNITNFSTGTLGGR